MVRSALVGSLFVLSIASAVPACSPGSDTEAGSGGRKATGGSGGGTNSGSGGTNGTGGGLAGSGGSAIGTGGTPGSGGIMATGGMTGSGGSGTGGLSGSGGASMPDGGMGASGGSTPDAGGGTGGSAGAGSGGSGGSGGASGGNGGAGGGGGGAGGTGVYNPCPTDGSVCKILPFGDSITHGDRSSDDAGYRSGLYKLILAAKQKATFVGSQTHGPSQVSGQPFPRMHEGRNGWTIDPGYNTMGNYGGISSLVPSPALNSSPHIILLMIGTNDLFARDTANMSTRLEVLIDKVAQNAPKALIVLAKITPLRSANAALTTYNGKIPGIVQSHATKGQHIIGVDMSTLPASGLGGDGIHPNDQGYAYIGNVWYQAIKDLLPK